MDYKSLAEDLLQSMAKSNRTPFQKHPRDMSQGEMGILMILSMNGTDKTSGELSLELEVSTGRIATALKSLEKKGYIERSRDDSDKRRVLVHITEVGKTYAELRHGDGLSDIEEMLRRLGEDDAREFVRIMKRTLEVSNIG